VFFNLWCLGYHVAYASILQQYTMFIVDTKCIEPTRDNELHADGSWMTVEITHINPGYNLIHRNQSGIYF